MIPDYVMIAIPFMLAAVIGGMVIPIVIEKTHNSKAAIVLTISLLIFLAYLTIHTHDCKNDYVKICEASHREGLGYNYCLNSGYSEGNPPLNKFCDYPIITKCKTIPNGCIDKSLENIDGYCLLPFVCFLFNQP